MELNQLEAFRNIASRQSISQAARDLYVSQSALAKTLQQIEEDLGTPLFDREGKKIFLNTSGEILLHYSDVANNSLAKAEELIQERKQNRENVVRVIFRMPIGNPVSALRMFINDNPDAIPHVAFDSEVRDDYDLEVFEAEDAIQDESVISVCPDKSCLLFLIKKYNIRTGIINTYPLIERIRISEIGNIFFTPFT